MLSANTSFCFIEEPRLYANPSAQTTTSLTTLVLLLFRTICSSTPAHSIAVMFSLAVALCF